MSKLDSNIINYIKMLSLDMINEAKSGDAGIILESGNVFYPLFMHHLKYNPNNPSWINRDRVLVSNRLLPMLYSTLHTFGYDISIDSLKEYKKMGSKTKGFSDLSCLDSFSLTKGDIIPHAIGVSLGERYLESIVKEEFPKSNLINFNTYCICTMEDMMSGYAYESLSYLANEKLEKLVIILIKDDILRDNYLDNVYKEDLLHRFKTLNFNVIEVSGNRLNSIDEAIDEAKESKKTSVVIVNSTYGKDVFVDKDYKDYGRILTIDELSTLRDKYNIDGIFNENKEYINETAKNVNKRMEKVLTKWEEFKNDGLNNSRVSQVIKFLENREVIINFPIDNLKINDTYNEELLMGNSRIFNIVLKSSPFILSLSNDNFKTTLCLDKKSSLMNSENPTGKNISLGNRTLALGAISLGLASLGFKVFVSMPLIESNLIRSSIKLGSYLGLDINYIFTNDNLLDTYEDSGFSVTDEINSLRLINNLTTLRPADINEIIGSYYIISTTKMPTAMIISNESSPKIEGTNPKYVLAGLYRIKRERGEANGIIISSGTEVNTALRVANELLPYGIDLRVVSAPSIELFDRQGDRYKNMLLPKELKTFVLEYGNPEIWNKYATDSDYIFGLNNYTEMGTKEELLKKYNLDIDYLKTKIIEKYKS